MGLRINTNVPSLAAQRAITQNTVKTDRAMRQLATGSRFADITEGAGDFAIAETLKGQVKGMEAARRNADNAISFVQVAEGGLNEQNNILIRMRELSVQAASDTFSDVEREMMSHEFNHLKEEFDRVAQTTTFGSQKLLSGSSKEYEFQVGANKGSDNIVKYTSDTNTTGSELGVDSLEVSDKSLAQDSLESIDTALLAIGKARASYGAVQSRFDHIVSYQSEQIVNLEDARSKIADTDFAKAYSDVTRGMALQQYQMAMLSTANQFPGNVIKLIA